MSTDAKTTSATRAGRWLFDAAVALVLVSAVFQLVTAHWEPAVRFVLLALIILSARWGNVPAMFAAAFAWLLLLAAWASVQHWYRDIRPADEVIHFLTPGSLAAAAYFVLVHQRMLPAPNETIGVLRSWAPVLWVTLVGVLAAVLWEFYEWVVEQLSPKGILVGYTDTVLDLLAGTLGSLTAGFLVLWWARHHSYRR